MIEISKAQTELDYSIIEQLADTIWREHYIPFLGKPQIDYMLDKFQTVKAIESQINEGFEYFVITFKKKPVGYIAIKKETDALFLSKIYVLNTQRGQGIGKAAMQFVETKAKSYHLKAISLTVNKYNHNTIKAYEKLGFTNLGSIVIDIGNGFVMDDYKMLKML